MTVRNPLEITVNPRPLALLAAFVGTVYAANLALERWGTVELPIIGWAAPAGVLFAGIAFGLRDALRESTGRHWRAWVLAGIALGTALSWWLSDAVTIPGGAVSIAAASGIAFGLSELADAVIYEPLRRRWVAAVVASNLVAAVVDSALFLWLAFGALDTMGGQIVGKALMILPAIPLVGWIVRRSDDEPDICWACDGATDEETHTCGAVVA